MAPRNTTKGGEVLHGVKAQADERFMSFKHTHVGSEDAVLFASYGLPDMKDTDYRIFLQGESTHSQGDAISIDESSLEPTGFDFIGGTGSEISHILVHGNVQE